MRRKSVVLAFMLPVLILMFAIVPLIRPVQAACVTTPCIVVSASPGSLTTQAFQLLTSTSTVAVTSGIVSIIPSCRTISLTTTVSSGGPAASLSPTSLCLTVVTSPATGFSTLTIDTSGTAAGTYTVTVTATDTTGGCTTCPSNSVVVTIFVIDVSITATPTLVTIPLGMSGTSKLTIATVGPWSLSTQGLVSTEVDSSLSSIFCDSLTCPLISPTASLNQPSVLLGPSQLINSATVLTVTCGDPITGGSFHLFVTIIASVPGFSSRSATVNFSCTLPPDISLVSAPPSLSVQQQSFGSTTVTVSTITFSGTVTVTTSSDTPGVVASAFPTPNPFACNPLTTPCNAFPLTIAVAGSVAAGTVAHIMVAGTGTDTATSVKVAKSIVVAVTVTQIPSFTIAAGPVTPASIDAGSFGTSTITVTAIGPTTGVTLFVSQSTPAGLICSLSSGVTFPPSPAMVSLTCSAAVAGDYSVRVIGFGGCCASFTAPLTFHVVADFTLSATPVAPSGIAPGTNGMSTVSLTSVKLTVSLTVKLTITITSATPSAKGVTISPAKTSISLGAGATVSFPLTIVTKSTATPGAYTINVTATDSLGATHAVTLSLTVT